VAADRVELTDPVKTQGWVLTVADLLSTLTVEAAVHHLDLVLRLDRPGPAAAPLAEVRGCWRACSAVPCRRTGTT
jgi:hypothetical protein